MLEGGRDIHTKMCFLLISFRDDLLITNNKCRVQEIDQRGRSDRFDVPFQHSKMSDGGGECVPVSCSISCPDAEDIVVRLNSPVTETSG